MGSNSLPMFPDDILGLFCLYLSSSALKQCCLTSRTFRHFSRPLLFEHLTIQNSADEMVLIDEDVKFWEALQVDPEIGKLVKSLKLLHIDGNGVLGFIPPFDTGPRLCYIMTHLPNLRRFAITRENTTPPWRLELSWATMALSEISSAIQHILNLPMLTDFHFTEQHEFEDANAMHQLLCLTRPSSLRSLHLYGFHLSEEADPPDSSLLPALNQAQIENLRLYYVDQDPEAGLRLISSFTSPASSFDVTRLSSLELWGIGVEDDTWIPALLDAQKSDSVLQHLGLFRVEGYPKDEQFIKSLSRFTSIRKLSISEDYEPIFDYEPFEVDNIVLGFAAAWIAALPQNIRSTVEELDLRIEAGDYWSDGLRGMDELLVSTSLNGMDKVKKIQIRMEEPGKDFDIEEFLRDEWQYRVSVSETDPDLMTICKWVASVVLPKASLEGTVEVDFHGIWQDN
ncbi:hypothetical protein DL96DRAFT_1581440 [Flagelloscypha sp. PMI_526]|nr:hypothetical protein DL96DRAFT_1581440 [Flagelloscypha sp. PMI_526]